MSLPTSNAFFSCNPFDLNTLYSGLSVPMRLTTGTMLIGGGILLYVGIAKKSKDYLKLGVAILIMAIFEHCLTRPCEVKGLG